MSNFNDVVKKYALTRRIEKKAKTADTPSTATRKLMDRMVGVIKAKDLTGTPVLSKDISKTVCPRCQGKIEAQVKLHRKGDKLPYCKKCRVIVPKA